MGINGLWELVKPTGTSKSIAELAEENGYSYRTRGTSMLKFGVDVSVMFDECLAAVNATKLYAHVHGGPLVTFFYKLCKFLKSPGIFVFVFDGPERPAMKRGRKSKLEDPWWIQPCIELINSMGFHAHRAPGEAEAELGRLSALGLIDAVISNDGDAFLFGARQVLRRIPKSDGLYSVYTQSSILEATSYGPGGLLLLALFAGGDYSNGIKDCGVSVVTALVKCGFGDRLDQYLSKLEDIKLERALIGLIEDIKHELLTNSKGHLSSRHPALAARLTLDAFNLTTISLYKEPITSWSSSHFPPDHNSWISREPDVLDIIQLCMKRFNWSTKENLGKHFQNTLLEGVFLRALSSPNVVCATNSREISTPFQVIEILEFKLKRRTNHPGPPWGRLRILTATTRDMILTVGGNERDLTSPVAEMFSFMVWTPLIYLPPGIFSLLPRPIDGLKWTNDPTTASTHHKLGPTQNSSDNNSQTFSNAGQKRTHGTAFPVNSELDEGSSSMEHRTLPSPFPKLPILPQDCEHPGSDSTGPFTVIDSEVAESSSMGRHHVSTAELPSIIDENESSDDDLPASILTPHRNSLAVENEGVIDLTFDAEAPMPTHHHFDGEIIDLASSDNEPPRHYPCFETIDGEVIDISDSD